MTSRWDLQLGEPSQNQHALSAIETRWTLHNAHLPVIQLLLCRRVFYLPFNVESLIWLCLHLMLWRCCVSSDGWWWSSITRLVSILTLETLPFPIPSASPPCYVQQTIFSQKCAAKKFSYECSAKVPMDSLDLSHPSFWHIGCPYKYFRYIASQWKLPHDRLHMLHLTQSIIQIPSGCPEFLLPTYLTYRAALKIPINLLRLFPAPQSPIKMFPRSVNKIKLYFTLAAYLQCLTGKKD